MIDQTERRAGFHTGKKLSEERRAVDLGPAPSFIDEIDVVVNSAHQHEVEPGRCELERVVLGRQALDVGQTLRIREALPQLVPGAGEIRCVVVRDDAPIRGQNDGREQLGVVAAARPRDRAPPCRAARRKTRAPRPACAARPARCRRPTCRVLRAPLGNRRVGPVPSRRPACQRAWAALGVPNRLRAEGRAQNPQTPSAVRMVRLLNNPPTTAVHRNAVCRRPRRRQPSRGSCYCAGRAKQ